MSVLLAAGLLFAGIVLNKTKYANAAVTAGEKYSQKDEGDIVLSVEKVGVISTGDDYMSGVSDEDITKYNDILAKYNAENYPFKTALYSNKEKNENDLLNQLYVDNTKAGGSWTTDTFPSYYFKDITVDSSKQKTVYHSGDYIMLENNVKTKNGTMYYYNPAITAYNEVGAVDMAESVLFSFGSYRLGTRTDAEGNVYTDLIKNADSANSQYNYAKDIQQINVTATRNGKTIVLPVVRQYGDNNYQDFSYIIPQKKGFDGHYEFVVEYRHNEEFKRQTFSFDLVFKSTYTEPETFENGSGYAYATMPKLELPTSGTTVYTLGSNEQYPTLTYDFSKYTLDYTHTLNGITTTYSYRRVKELSLVGVKYKLVCTISSSNGEETRTIGLDDETKAVLVFTEIGDYKFDYDYIYNDEKNDMGFSLNSGNLTIKGFELKYSKVGYNEAQMRYLEINKHQNDKVVLIVPNGYELNKETTTSALGVAFKVNLTSGSTKTGVINKNQDAMINVALGGNLSTFVANASKLEPQIDTVIKEEMYQTTNQGGVWLSSNLKYVENEHENNNVTKWNSFYYYSTSPITSQTENLANLRKEITNTTTFNQVGYYLVFVKTQDVDQVFAFRYSNETTNIEVNALTVDENGNPVLDGGNRQYTTPVGSGRYTNQPVKISWVEPGVFERAVVVKYYASKNVFLTRIDEKANGINILTSKQMIEKYSPIEIANGTILGADLLEKQGSSYLLEATNEGQAKTYRSFTVDKTDISGVAMYAVKTTIGNAGGKIYSIQANDQGEYMQISAISNGLATISWDDKLSGANVRANYYFTPIIKSNSKSVEVINTTASSTWFTNRYILGSETGPFYIDKPENLEYTLAASNVVKNNGIYLFVLTDEAGNSCKFMFVCDGSEQYFKIGNNFYSQQSVVFADNATVEFATHKAIELYKQDKQNKTDTEKMIDLFVGRNATTDYLKSKGYFAYNENNIYTLKSLFNTANSTNYLTVENELMTAFEHSDKKAEIKVSKPSATQNPYYVVNKNDKNENSSSYNVKLNIYGKNQFGYSDERVKNNSNSYLWIEINDDHSLGMAYFAADVGSLNNEDFSRRLFSGSGAEGIKGAHATSDNLVAFYFTQNTGDYEIDSIKYEYYPITNNYNNDNKNLYFYNSSTTFNLFTKGEDLDQAPFGKVSGQTARYYRTINVVDNQTQEGLYVVTRTYVNDENPQKYWFIVDRKGIIENADGESKVGQYINITLLEETSFNNFNKYGLKEKTLVYYNSDGSEKENIKYTVSLQTNKVPAEVKVPVGKFFDGTNASSYEAGRLNVTIYFIDNSNQLNIKGQTGPLILFSSKDYAGSMATSNKEGYYTNNKYLSIDLNEYLKGDIHDKFILNDGNNSNGWLWLPGEYVVVIEDNVVSSSSSAHKYAFGFEIPTKLYPATDVYSVVNEQDDVSKANAKADTNNHVLTTADEYVKVELPAYNKDGLNAQVDPNYLVVKRSVDGGAEETYIDYKYTHLGGESLPEMIDGKRTIKLNTELRRVNGVIDFANSAKNIVYKIYIRFKVSQGDKVYDSKYINCYKYYDDQGLVYYYETVYTVTVDRVPPTANSSMLERADNLVASYNQEDEVNGMFNLAVHETSSGLFFTNEMTVYYKTNDVKDLYAFVVNSNTGFDKTDIAKLYYKNIDNIAGANLNMPVVNFASYTLAPNISSATQYGNILGDTVSGYYEIVELDAAGNQNQYIILYNTPTNNLSFSFNATYMNNGEITSGNVTLGSANNQKSSITLFELNGIVDSETAEQVDKFYKIELTNLSTSNKTIINTNATTKFTNSGLTAQIVEAIKNYGRGNYNLKVSSRAKEQIFVIDYYDQNNRVELNARNLVEKIGDRYNINLKGANVEKDGVLYYAKQINITATTTTSTTTTYYGQNIGGKFNYYIKQNASETDTPVDEIISCVENATYQIVMIDAFGSESTCRFDTAQGFDNFHNIVFGSSAEDSGKYFESAGCYYSYIAATINYNTALYKKLIVSYRFNNGNKVDYEVVVNSNNGIDLIQDGTKLNSEQIVYRLNGSTSQTIIIVEPGKVMLYPFNSTANGAVVEYIVELWYGDVKEYSYNVCLDTETKSATLKNTDNIETKMVYAYNKEFQQVAYDTISSGVMNLMWTPVENDHFTYQYILHEKLIDDSIADYDLSGSSSRVINTLADSKGVYWFEIKVYTADGKYLGNKVYAFSVVAVLSDLYYVQTEDMVAIKANSFFTFDEFKDLGAIAADNLKTDGELSLPITNIPLFISNKKLTVIVSEEQGAKYVKCSGGDSFVNAGKTIGKLTLYRVYTKAYSRYLATLEIVNPADQMIANSFNFVYDVTSDGQTSKTTVPVKNFVNSIYIEADKTLTLNFAQLSAMESNITRKNSIVLKVYHNGKLLEQKQINNNGGLVNYRVMGGGKYSFEVCDLAGNTHQFSFDDVQGSVLTVNVMKNVYFTMNGNAPINNAVVNEPVELTVYEPFNYDSISSRPVEIKAYKNGQAYNFEQKNYTYIFSDYGNYKVIFTAKFNGQELTSTINFAIINKNEARASYDLTSVSRYDILSVKNQNGKDITNEFLELISPQSGNGRLLTYQTVISNAEALDITAGKQSFEILYQVEDGIYPSRQAVFAFTLNDEVPTIECSIGLGKTTTKGFEITFNPGMIFEQVGDSYLYINDKLICEINENSSLAQMSYSISQKTDGAGDFYVKLVGSSGSVITSFKVVVKEPLNVWAIIIIVVVVAIVLGVTITIIVLRNKMRIR